MEAFASFRFLTLTDEQAKELSSCVSGVDFGFHYKTGNKVGCIRLLDSSQIESIGLFAKKHNFKPAECDIFVSIASENKDEVWGAPRSVNNMLKIFDCPIVFSYTC